MGRSSGLLRERRLQKILEEVRAKGQVNVSELSRHFGVSEVTIRRDLKELARRNLLHRIHGGALPASPLAPEPPVVQRLAQERRWKQAIGRAAANLVHDGESVFLGSGSTTTYVAHYFRTRHQLTVVTNALTVSLVLASVPDITLVVTGGMMRASELSLIGHIAENALREVRVDKVIMGIRALDVEAGLTNDYLPEVMTDRAIIEMADDIIVVADHTKFGKVASAFVAPIDKVTTIVTDTRVPPEMVAQLQARGIRVIQAEPDEESALDIPLPSLLNGLR
ncbi:MAG: DeoR/GlpR transcriptional regulator [Chloroflexi bacterium]|nr:DeoR/GlpR transcriptional regulator [Chloroflexota bacterium]